MTAQELREEIFQLIECGELDLASSARVELERIEKPSDKGPDDVIAIRPDETLEEFQWRTGRGSIGL